jgi:hypothetical protein
MLRLLIYAYALSLAAAEWQCPSTWPEKCWIMNPDLTYNVQQCSGIASTDCWNCSFCPNLFRNEFGTYYDLVGFTSDLCNPPPHMVPFTSTTANNCDLFQFDCEKGFHYDANLKCVPCERAIESYECDRAYFPKR